MAEKYKIGQSIDLSDGAGKWFPAEENVVVCIDEKQQVNAVSMNHGPFGRESVIISSDDYHKWSNGDMIMQDFSEKYFPQYHNGSLLRKIVQEVIEAIKERVTNPNAITFDKEQEIAFEKLKFLSGNHRETMNHNFTKVMDMAEEQLLSEGANKDRLSDIRKEVMAFAADSDKLEVGIKEVINDLKERTVTPTMRSFSEDAKQRIRDFASMASAETLKEVKEAVADDPEVKNKPKQWFADAVKEFDAIVSGDDLSNQIHTHFHR